ncbi:MAG: tRNA cyclic N6-threonylcarbamoyladenosine(37) synthase TcdA [Gammaproteobacteria bacterium]|nr:tRNA cyclic N6-threonylcarbamoyladenosine(37) synthase TcdA [Gammaproteobacteria bacterium]MDH3535303.1 tRNA cyclic N6-threonylcarbamoyladenosine(37) synthase TcdA [Gammaproteobacteria bacterium]
MNSLLSQSYRERFEGVARVYGTVALAPLQRAHFCIVGIGGVGSWAAEACARTGIGSITLIDHDDIHVSNTNRQLHTTIDTIGLSKVEVLRERILSINPECNCSAVDDLVTRANLEKFNFRQFDYVIEAIDHVSHKLSLMHYCRRHKIRCVSTGGAGGQTDPTQILVKDLTLSFNDPLLAKVRSTLRQQLGYSRNPKRRYGMDCVFSGEQPLYPVGDGSVSHEKPVMLERTTLDCATGLGSFVGVTACFGFTAAAHAISKYLSRGSLSATTRSRRG